MADQPSLPPLFGRLTAVLSEHEHLGVILRRLGQMCTTLDAQRELEAELSPAPLFRELRSDLERHFASEESDAHFGVIVQERPALDPNVDALKVEHRLMLSWIAQLLTLAEDQRQWPRLPVPTRRLIEKLREHERAETLLLQDFFRRDEARGG